MVLCSVFISSCVYVEEGRYDSAGLAFSPRGDAFRGEGMDKVGVCS